MPKKFYAVKAGHKPGIYDYAEAQKQTAGYSKAEWKGFNVHQDALDFLNGAKSEPKTQTKDPKDEDKSQEKPKTQPKAQPKAQEPSKTQSKAQEGPKSESDSKTQTRNQSQPKKQQQPKGSASSKSQEAANKAQTKTKDESNTKSKSVNQNQSKPESDSKKTKDQSKKDQSKTQDQPKARDQPKKEQPKKEETKKEQPKKDQTKKDRSQAQSKGDSKSQPAPHSKNQPKGRGKAKGESGSELESTAQALLKAEADAKALAESLQEAEAKVESHKRALELAQKKTEKADNPRAKKQSFYIVDCFIFDTREAAIMYYGRPDVQEAPSFEQAEKMVQDAGFDEAFKSFSEDISYVNEQGKTMFQVFVDGACSSNGTPNAKAGYGLYFGENNPWNVAAPVDGASPTNQKAELLAVSKAYQLLEKRRTGNSYEILTDSQYAIDCLTKWRYEWQKNSWKTSEGKPVENSSVIKACVKVMDRLAEQGHELKKVQGHGGSKGNKKADALARQGVQASNGHLGGNEASKSWTMLGLSSKVK
ncbi:Ribonuclease H [Yarrowia sp. C11]|nr:Ribonuclease H [Yarrowia sp. C11]